MSGNPVEYHGILAITPKVSASAFGNIRSDSCKEWNQLTGGKRARAVESECRLG